MINWTRRCNTAGPFSCNALYIDRDNLRLGWDGPDSTQIALVEQREIDLFLQNTDRLSSAISDKCPPNSLLVFWMLTAFFVSVSLNFPVPS